MPTGRELSNGHTSFTPIPNTNPVQYSQPTYTAKLLSHTLAANKDILSKLSITEKPKLPFPVRDNISLAALLEMGIDDADRAWPIFQVFWREITAANSSITDKKIGQRPPVLMCLDNMAHVMVNSKYQILNEAGKLAPVHAHDLVLVKHFFDHISGKAELANGGMFLAATSASDAPKSDAMDVGIAIAETRQTVASNDLTQKAVPYSTPYSTLQALSPDKDPNPAALSNFWSPFKAIDTRVLDSLKSVDVIRVEGLNHKEATSMMRYWTRSGMSRGAVLPWVVDEARALSGGAVIGQLHQAVVSFLQRETVKVEGETGGGKIRVH
jgi:small subunit ribosomal protein S29